ncbi:hypothetical protein CGSSp11BS70_03139 [Streptococcus pneumoniae SP11-BS70]|nr:hypothetical protein CGSSp11BS70_03139 [Streptococcus pneumoniae SP11-BS70]EDK74669.1 hypothetical protein CGSSp3BS71_03562 [Streptococcus pneumoniae SP3-BS71]
MRMMFSSLVSDEPNFTAFSACFQQPQALCERKDCNFSIYYFLASSNLQSQLGPCLHDQRH